MANIAREYATKRYRSNLINWGMVPFLCPKENFSVGDYVYVEGIRTAILNGEEEIKAKHISKGKVKEITLLIGGLTADEKQIILAGCLINYNKNKAKN